VLVAGINIQGTVIAARPLHRKRFDFAARNHITPVIERFLMTRDGVEEGKTARGEK
jgi:hypothetical protein